MSFSIYFVNKGNLYLEVGFKKRVEARRKLEEIANCFVGSSDAVGEIWYRNDYVEKKARYEIRYDKNRAFLKYKGSMKNFLKD